MKMLKKCTEIMKYGLTSLSLILLTKSAFATDLLNHALQGDIADSFGSNSKFWSIFILVDIMLATAMAIKSRNPMVFLGVGSVAFIPAFLLKTFVF